MKTNENQKYLNTNKDLYEIQWKATKMEKGSFVIWGVPSYPGGSLRIQAAPPVYEGLQIMSLTSPRARGVSRARRPGAQTNANQSLTN